jgi:hypothetical protein
MIPAEQIGLIALLGLLGLGIAFDFIPIVPRNWLVKFPVMTRFPALMPNGDRYTIRGFKDYNGKTFCLFRETKELGLEVDKNIWRDVFCMPDRRNKQVYYFRKNFDGSIGKFGIYHIDNYFDYWEGQRRKEEALRFESASVNDSLQKDSKLMSEREAEEKAQERLKMKRELETSKQRLKRWAKGKHERKEVIEKEATKEKG